MTQQDVCFFKQHPVAHAGLQSDFIDTSLLPNMLRSCYFQYTTPYQQGIFDTQGHFGLMREFYLMKPSHYLSKSKVSVYKCFAVSANESLDLLYRV